jgi:hypothetical protein
MYYQVSTADMRIQYFIEGYTTDNINALCKPRFKPQIFIYVYDANIVGYGDNLIIRSLFYRIRRTIH